MVLITLADFLGVRLYTGLLRIDSCHFRARYGGLVNALLRSAVPAYEDYLGRDSELALHVKPA